MLTENWDDPDSPLPLICQPKFEKDSSQSSDSRTFSLRPDSMKENKDDLNWRNHDKFNSQKPNVQGKMQTQTFWNKRCSSRTYMKVESSKISNIIGRQGSRIKCLQERTGTHIKIGDYCRDDNNLQMVIISGDKVAQKECQKLIEELIAERQVEVVREPVKESPIVIDWDALNARAKKAEAEKLAKCLPIKKNFYIEDPDVANMSEEEVEKFRLEKSNIIVKVMNGGDEKILNPVKTFAQAFQHYPDIMREIEKQGFESPTAIQCQAWPVLMSGKDLIAISQTGSGKTLAYLLPALIHIHGQKIPMSERRGPSVLIISPTRELALQIEKEVQKYSYKGIKSLCIYGGGDRKEQKHFMKKGVEIIIATPGRLNDFICNNFIDVTTVSYLVLDEADRMLDMGFEPQIRKILIDIRTDRQSVMTSATWPRKVQSLAERYISNPIQVYIGSLDLTAVHSVTQTVLMVREEEKKDYLFDFLRNLSKDDKVIVFVTRKTKADDLSCDLALSNILCQSIHGDRQQLDRELAINDLKTGAVKILIATDVASRGIDISDITKIFNYDFPKNMEEYVHRVGRTGRAGKKGEAITLFTTADWSFSQELIQIMEEAEQPVPEQLYKVKEKFLNMQQRKQEDRMKSGNYGRGRGRKWRISNDFGLNFS